jgi:hypothetical protein
MAILIERYTPGQTTRLKYHTMYKQVKSYYVILHKKCKFILKKMIHRAKGSYVFFRDNNTALGYHFLLSVSIVILYSKY